VVISISKEKTREVRHTETNVVSNFNVSTVYYSEKDYYENQNGVLLENVTPSKSRNFLPAPEKVEIVYEGAPSGFELQKSYQERLASYLWNPERKSGFDCFCFVGEIIYGKECTSMKKNYSLNTRNELDGSLMETSVLLFLAPIPKSKEKSSKPTHIALVLENNLTLSKLGVGGPLTVMDAGELKEFYSSTELREVSQMITGN
jgi:hypothetical protein